ncbi:MAG TPA: enoyl-CoA hydratase-related protein, partial [Nitrospira sp.]|nr:enoyl-CoA hydratase-related protein [Nitrospira sp.]
MKDSVSVLVESHNGLARVTLNRPQRRNALDASMIDTLYEAFDKLAQDPSVRAIVLGGAGSAFCAGADLNWMGSEGAVSGSGAQKDAERLMKMYRAIDECPCPVIGRIQGAAFGGGVGLIAVCDIAVVVEDATFTMSEVRLGLIPAVIAPFLLRKAGESFVRRYCLTGEPFSASAAQQFHLVHDVIEQDRLDARVDELVQMILRLAPQATRDTKALFRRLLTLSEDEQRTACMDANALARVSAEAQEGLR